MDEAFEFLPHGAIEQIRADLQIGYTAMAIVFAAPLAGSLPALWFTARSDRTGRRSIVLVGALLTALALAGFAAAPGPALAIGAAAAWGFGGSLLVHGVELELAVVSDPGPGGNLHQRLRQCNLWGVAGDVLGPLTLAAVLAAGWSWRVAFWLAAVLTLLYAGWLRRHPFSPVAAAPELDEAPAWRDPVAWKLGAYAFFLMPFDETWLAFLIAWLQVHGGFSGSAAALAGVVAVLGAALGFGPLAARLARRSERSVLVGTALALSAAGSVVAGVPAWLAILAGLAVNAGTAAAWVTLQHSALTLRPGSEGQVMSLVVAIEHATVVLPLALGVLADRAGLVEVFVAYLLLGAALVATGLSVRRPAVARER